MIANYVLESRNLTKHFGNFTAVSDVSIKVQRGTIHALIGPNGAGKTTVFNLLTKYLQPTRGQILLDGQDITSAGPAAIARAGLVRSFQISAVFPHMTVMENVRIGLQSRTGNSYQFWRSQKSLRALEARALELLDSVGLAAQAGLTTAGLPYGQKRALELATTLALEPTVMLLDEPTQGMGHEDVARVTALIRQVSAGRTVLMVEHNMSVVSSIADIITVMQRGMVIDEGPYAQVSRNPKVIEAYMGTSVPELAQPHP